MALDYFGHLWTLLYSQNCLQEMLHAKLSKDDFAPLPDQLPPKIVSAESGWRDCIRHIF